MIEQRRVAFAVAAHPDDIEFMMAGTLILLRDAGYELHYMTVANGSCGTATRPKQEIIRIRAREARAAARLLGAAFHPSLADDIGICYEAKLLARLAAVVRKVAPTIMLVPSPEDYMEDHVNAGRLAVTAAFCREMRNFRTIPSVPPTASDVTIYHAMPAGLRDPLRRRIVPEYFVGIGSVLEEKRRALAQHRSQKEWLDVSQGMDAYLTTMEELSAEVGRMSGRFRYAEGWRRHSHLGFCEEEADPLAEALGRRVLVNEGYRRRLEEPLVGTGFKPVPRARRRR